MHKVPQRVYDALKIVADSFGGVGGGSLNTEQTPTTGITETVDIDRAPFCIWGIANATVKVFGLIPEITNSEPLRGIIPSIPENDSLLDSVPDNEKTKDHRISFDRYAKLIEMIPVPDSEFPTLTVKDEF